MFKRTLTYTDLNGKLVENEELYFNLNKIEMAKLANKIDPVNSDMEGVLTKLIETKNVFKIITVMADIILAAYGEKSADGKRFNKSPEITEAFENSVAYAEYVEYMLANENEAMEFVKAAMAEASGSVEGNKIVDDAERVRRQAELSATIAAKREDVHSTLVKAAEPEEPSLNMQSEFEEFLKMKRAKEGK